MNFTISDICVCWNFSYSAIASAAVFTVFPNGRDEVSILVMGRAGIGKQTLIDGLFGKDEVRTDCGNTIAMPPNATCDKYNTSGGVIVNVIKWQLPSKEEMKDAVNSLGNVLEMTELVWFALRMDDARFRPADEQMMQEMSHQLGDSAWTKVSFVLTFANLVRGLDQQQNVIETPEYRTERGELLEKRARKILRNKNVSRLVIKEIPFLPAGLPTKDKLTGDQEPWTSHLMKCVANRAGGKVGRALRRAVKGHVKIYKTVSNKCNYSPEP